MKNKKGIIRLPIILMGVLLVLAISCDKEDDNNEPDKSTFTDPRDGKVYQTVVIGNQEWLAENLAYAPSSGNYWAYNNDNANVEVYGYLYDWETALNVCPEGWHLPSYGEWNILSKGAGGKLKATGTIESGTGWWRDPNLGATNQTGFTALPSGAFSAIDGRFYAIGSTGFWWSASETNSNQAWYRIMYHIRSNLNWNDHDKESGYSVRCVRD